MVSRVKEFMVEGMPWWIHPCHCGWSWWVPPLGSASGCRRWAPLDV